MLYHVSVERVKDDLFYPRIPEIRIDGEDDTIKRICFSKKIEKCITTMPNGVHKMKNLILFENEFNIPAIAYIYSIDEETIDRKNKISSSTLVRRNLVRDAIVNQETWIINQNVKCNCELVRVRDVELVLKEYKCYEGKKVSVVKRIELESSHEPYERKFGYKLSTEEDYNIVRNLALETGCKVEDLPNYNIRIIVPPMVDVAPVWEKVKDIKWNYLKTFYEEQNGKPIMSITTLLGYNLSNVFKQKQKNPA